MVTSITVKPNWITAGVVFLATLFVMIAMAADELAVSNINGADKYCGWLKFEIQYDHHSDVTKKYKSYCDDHWRNDKDDYCDAEDNGEAWIIFSLLAFFVGIGSLVTLLTPALLRYGHFAYDAVAAFCCFLAIMIWYAGDAGCWDSGNDTWGDDLQMGASGVIMIFAMLLFMIAIALRIMLPKMMVGAAASSSSSYKSKSQPRSGGGAATDAPYWEAPK